MPIAGATYRDGVAYIDGALCVTPTGSASITGGTITGTNAGYVLARSFVAATAPADANLNTLATIAIPAGAIGPNGFVEVWMQWTWTSSVNAKTPRIDLGASTLWAPAGFANTTGLSQSYTFGNRNSAASQVGQPQAFIGGLGTTTLNAVTATENTATALNLLIRATKATAGETMTLEGYSVRVYYGA
jgi:hypothetical protein